MLKKTYLLYDRFQEYIQKIHDVRLNIPSILFDYSHTLHQQWKKQTYQIDSETDVR